jgi:hypothetical protein
VEFSEVRIASAAPFVLLASRTPDRQKPSRVV